MNSAARAGTDAEQAGTDAERAGTDAEQAGTDAEQATQEAQRAAEAGRPAPEDAPRDEGPGGSGDPHDRDRPCRDWHEEAHDRSGRRGGEREWGEWAGWTGWGGWPGAAGQHDWADPEAYRDLERLAKQFSRELRSAAWHAQAVSEDALRDLRGILDETIDRIKAEVFKGKTPPGDPEDSAPLLPTNGSDRADPRGHGRPAARAYDCPPPSRRRGDHDFRGYTPIQVMITTPVRAKPGVINS